MWSLREYNHHKTRLFRPRLIILVSHRNYQRFTVFNIVYKFLIETRKQAINNLTGSIYKLKMLARMLNILRIGLFSSRDAVNHFHTTLVPTGGGTPPYFLSIFLLLLSLIFTKLSLGLSIWCSRTIKIFVF